MKARYGILSLLSPLWITSSVAHAMGSFFPPPPPATPAPPPSNSFVNNHDRIREVNQTSVRNPLPVLTNPAALARSTVTPGRIEAGGVIGCGDMDVYDFHYGNPTRPPFDTVPPPGGPVDFLLPSTTLTIPAVVGYWVVAEGTNPLPKNTNTSLNGGAWHPMAYGNIRIDSSGNAQKTRRMYDVNKNWAPKTPIADWNGAAAVTNGKETAVIVAEHLGYTMGAARSAYKLASAGTTTYRLFSSLMTCTAYQASGGTAPGANLPSAPEILMSLTRKGGLPNLAQDVLTAYTDPAAPPTQVQVRYNSPGTDMGHLEFGLDGSLTGGTIYTRSLTANALYVLAGRVKSDTLYDNASTQTDLFAIYNGMRAGGTSPASHACKDLPTVGPGEAAGFAAGAAMRWFEPFPYQLTCAQLDVMAPLGPPGVNEYNDLYFTSTGIAKNPGSPGPTGTDRNELSLALYRAAILQEWQNAIALNYPAPDVRCFDSGARYINHIVNSVMIPLDKVGPGAALQASGGNVDKILTTKGNAEPSLHPEGLFALNDHPTIYTSTTPMADHAGAPTGDIKAVFGKSKYTAALSDMVTEVNGTAVQSMSVNFDIGYPLDNTTLEEIPQMPSGTGDHVWPITSAYNSGIHNMAKRIGISTQMIIRSIAPSGCYGAGFEAAEHYCSLTPEVPGFERLWYKERGKSHGPSKKRSS